MDKLDKKVLGMLLIQDLYIESTKLTPVPHSRFQTLLDEDKINKIAIGQNYISGSLKEPAPSPTQPAGGVPLSRGAGEGLRRQIL